MSLIILGSVNVDLVVRSPRLPAPGETVLGGEFFTAAGGKGANQAVAAVRASNGPVMLIAAMGSDAHGDGSLANFRREGIVVEYVKRSSRPTGVALIMVDDRGENMISVASGANLDLLPADVDAVPDDVFRGAKVFLACLELPLETVARGLARAKAAGLLTILNPAPITQASQVRELLPMVDVLTPNEGELRALAGRDRSDAEELAAVAGRVQAFGSRRLVATLGSEGCYVLDGAAALGLPGYRVAAVDATGAGDAFNGALAVAQAEGRGLADAAAWANRAAALSVQRLGAQPSLPTRQQIEAFRP